MRRLPLLAVIALLVLSGCTAPISTTGLETDELGVVGGYAYDDTLEIDDPTALTEEELEAVTYRAMARIEVLRGLAFEEEVDVEVTSREEFDAEGWYDGSADRFTNELWRGAFVVDGETDANEAFSTLYADAVAGYYSNGQVVIVSDDPDEHRISRTTLVHELVHALQDQHFGLTRDGETLDERRAEQGVIEGEADYLPQLYDQRCEEEWECLEDGDLDVTPLEERPINPALFLSIYTPYSEGPAFVDHLRAEGGWAAVDTAYDERPASTTQVIHPERYPDAAPVDVEVEDRSSSAWEPMTADGETRTETVGEATLFATLWADGVIDRPLTEGVEPYSVYNYSHPATDGWAGDTFLAYESESGEEVGHVWELAWESPDDAEQFQDAYVDLLTTNGAEPLGDGAYLIDDGAFSGAYAVDRDGEDVRIVGGPSVDDLEGIGGPSTASTVAEQSATAPTPAVAPSAGPTAPAPTAAEAVFE